MGSAETKRKCYLTSGSSVVAKCICATPQRNKFNTDQTLLRSPVLPHLPTKCLHPEPASALPPASPLPLQPPGCQFPVRACVCSCMCTSSCTLGQARFLRFCKFPWLILKLKRGFYQFGLQGNFASSVKIFEIFIIWE